MDRLRVDMLDMALLALHGRADVLGFRCVIGVPWFWTWRGKDGYSGRGNIVFFFGRNDQEWVEWGEVLFLPRFRGSQVLINA